MDEGQLTADKYVTNGRPMVLIKQHQIPTTSVQTGTMDVLPVSLIRDLHSIISCFTEGQNGLPFLVTAYTGCTDKRPLNGCLTVSQTGQNSVAVHMQVSL